MRQGKKILILQIFFFIILFVGTFYLYKDPSFIYKYVSQEPMLFGLNSKDKKESNSSIRNIESSESSEATESTQAKVEIKKDRDDTPKETLIRQAFAEKYDRFINSVAVEITQDTGNHVKGIVDFDGMGLAATFYAGILNGKWEIAAVENGTLPCAEANLYKFPVEMVPECFNISTGNIEIR